MSEEALKSDYQIWKPNMERWVGAHQWKEGVFVP